MSNLQTFNLIKEKVNKYQRDYGLEEASVAFEWLALEIILNLNSDEIEDAITDGAMDGGIDAVHIVGNDVHIFNFKYTEQWEKISNYFPEGEINKLLVTTSQI